MKMCELLYFSVDGIRRGANPRGMQYFTEQRERGHLESSKKTERQPHCGGFSSFSVIFQIGFHFRYIFSYQKQFLVHIWTIFLPILGSFQNSFTSNLFQNTQKSDSKYCKNQDKRPRNDPNCLKRSYSYNKSHKISCPLCSKAFLAPFFASQSIPTY